MPQKALLMGHSLTHAVKYIKFTIYSNWGAFSAYSAGNISLSRVRSPLGLLSYLFGRKLDFFTSKAAYIKSFSKDSVFNPFLKYFVSRRGWHLCVLMLEVCCIVGGGVGGFYAHLGLINWLCRMKKTRCTGIKTRCTGMGANKKVNMRMFCSLCSVARLLKIPQIKGVSMRSHTGYAISAIPMYR